MNRFWDQSAYVKGFVMEYKKLYEKIHQKDTSYFDPYSVFIFEPFLNGHTLNLGSGQSANNVAVSKNVIFSDISLNAIRMAKRKAQGHFIVLDAQNLPFRTGSIDSILCKDLLEHVPDDEKCAHEMERCIVDGGYICVQAPRRLESDFTEIWYDLRAYEEAYTLQRLFKNSTLVWQEFCSVKPRTPSIAKIYDIFKRVITKFFNFLVILKITSFWQFFKRYPDMVSRDYARYLYERSVERPILEIKPSLGLNMICIFKKKL
jgi:ubiquinone/menaquinone biosynthesis C-methylase UbiE